MVSEERIEELTRIGTLSADSVVMEMKAQAWYTPAQITRAGIKRAIECLIGNDLIRIPEPKPGDFQGLSVIDPPFNHVFGPDIRPIINKFHNFEAEDVISRSENDLCECDRPDTRDNPHRHTLTVACIYWMAGRPSQEDRLDACRQLNLPGSEKVPVD